MLPELRRRHIHTNVLLPNVVHQTFWAGSIVEYAYTAISLSSCSVGEDRERIPITFNEVMSLPEKERWKAALDTEKDSLRKNNVYTTLPSASVPIGHRSLESRWVYKKEADLSYNAR